ncbi:hypothetical protein SF1_19340 [Sphingobacterium faecium NBRC 15299]|uniref:hypothetical protein n=1 Tax=Sphingobacterium faecium TaxID=34087 RepID=UPI000D3C5FA3|nr:hypothetical protein [Sphingobacterium faecium]MQP28034.1 hypothetical protein [Sphingobacterium faecium]PTX09419.1 hypothetical protein C8N37_10647 [Sphingobacterium faecium]GEM63952.1 hypothetical protein SF1_19340 [Sphingobacterium faecium NBRC 15299]
MLLILKAAIQVLNFEEIYHEYWKRIFRLCMGYVNDHDAAKDLSQGNICGCFSEIAKVQVGSISWNLDL